jgi:uncharacterized RDD family membrane protein YckC
MTTDPTSSPAPVPAPTPVASAPAPEPALAPVTAAPAVAYAGAVSRLAAYVVDLAALSGLSAAGGAVAAYLVAVVTGHRLELSSDRDLAGVGLVLWWLLYFAGSWAVTGRTLGMALFGLRVVRPDGTRASTLAALIRAVTFPLSLALFGLGFVGILVDRQRRALHDLLAGTTVIYTFPARPAAPPTPATPATPATPTTPATAAGIT